MIVTDLPQIIPLEMARFRFADDEPLAGQLGVVMAYVVRHGHGLLLFDTGFGFGNAELDAYYQPRARRLPDVLAEAGITLADIGDPVAWEGRSRAPDKAAYDRSIERLRGLHPVQVHFGHDRLRWTA